MSRDRKKPQSGYTQFLEGDNLAIARVTGADIHHKHCVQIARKIKGMYAGSAIEFLEDVIAKRKAVPYVVRHRGGRGGNTMAGHRKGKMGPGRYPRNASRVFIKLIESAMDNARQHHEDIEAEEMQITHVAAHRGEIVRNMRPRARGRATASNHYKVNIELFLEHDDEGDEGDEDEGDF
ncbi:MAG: 50S ribosomal protein L22 [Anaerolineales bacterium]|jgi:large subunit ribosomal protein L22|nr:50S ribosomal protein L22 [Anaerolineales bacterium]